MISYQTKNGKEKYLGNFHLLPIMSLQGQVSGMVITFADVSPHISMANKEKEREVLRLSALIEGQEQERGRISRELHDGLGQMLTAMKYSLNALEIPSEKSFQLSKLLDETIHETSRISENLLPSKLKNFDLKTCISSICNSNYFNSNTIINFDCSKESIEVDAVQKIHIYRVAQEAINNALKYAKASMISVQLYILDDQLVLTIEDDGKGFDVKSTMDRTTTKHQGLQNMKDRVEIMRGKIDIDSNEKLGTIISIQIPYAKRHQNYNS